MVDCGGDAHHHVRTCSKNPHYGQYLFFFDLCLLFYIKLSLIVSIYFASIETFLALRAAEKRANILRFLQGLPNNTKLRVLEQVYKNFS